MDTASVMLVTRGQAGGGSRRFALAVRFDPLVPGVPLQRMLHLVLQPWQKPRRLLYTPRGAPVRAVHFTTENISSSSVSRMLMSVIQFQGYGACLTPSAAARESPSPSLHIIAGRPAVRIRPIDAAGADCSRARVRKFAPP